MHSGVRIPPPQPIDARGLYRTENGTWYVLEYKQGKDHASNEDTQYKEHLGTVWAETCGSGFSFTIVTKENVTTTLSSLGT